MNRLRWKYLIILATMIFGNFASAGPLSMVMELETNLTIKIKSIISPVDPDAIVIVNVTPRRVNTNLPVTGMEALGFFSVEQTGRVEDADIESIKVQIYSALEPFPEEISRIIETSVKPYTKRGQVTIAKVDAKTTEILNKRKEASNIQADSLQKISMEYSEHLYRLVYILSGSVGAVIFIVSLMMMGAMMMSFRGLAKKIGEIKIETGDSGGGSARLPELAAAAAAPRDVGRGGGGGNSSNGPTLDDMSVISLKALLSDCYWCEKDGYANWIWAQISPDKKSELLTLWPDLGPYVEHFALSEPGEDRYHNDPFYLYPTPLEAISNEDLMGVLATNKLIWWGISAMRKESLRISLRDRIEYTRGGTRGTAVKMPVVKSHPRSLPIQLQMAELSQDDENLLFEQPYLVNSEVARKLPSLVWLALLPNEEITKILTSVSGQSLAECWVGPEAVLQKLQNAMPEKRRALFAEYLSKGSPRRTSPFLKVLSDAAIPLLEKSWPQDPGLKDVSSESNAA